jgi:hypothetical protein
MELKDGDVDGTYLVFCLVHRGWRPCMISWLFHLGPRGVGSLERVSS